MSGVMLLMGAVAPRFVNPLVWAKSLPWVGFGLIHVARLILESTRSDSHLLPYEGGRIMNGCFFAYYIVWYLMYAFVGPVRPFRDSTKSEQAV